jgi:hypothetical protein
LDWPSYWSSACNLGSRNPSFLTPGAVTKEGESEPPEMMSESGQTRRFELRPVTSGLPLSTDILRVRRHVSNV